MYRKIPVLAGIFIVVLAAVLFFQSPSNKRVKITPPNVGDGGLLPQNRQIEGFQGNVLAGNKALFIDFNKPDYEKAKKENKIILLDFYANWCPICRAEEPEIFAGFNSLTTNQIVGFRVNFKDSNTDADEQALAREFNIPYQHTKVILKNGAETSRFVNQWTRDDLINAINSSLPEQ